MSYMTVEEMREKKRELGYSYETIAELSGVPASTVRKVLAGSTKAPRSATLQALSRAFSQDPSVVFRDSISKSTGGYRCSLSEQGGKPHMFREAETEYGIEKKQGEYTLEDYLALPEEKRVELIDGIIYDMGAPTGYHQLITGQLYATLLSWIRGRKGKCMPFISPVDVQLDGDDKTILQPDLLILCDKSKYTPARIIGAPDFVAEVLSKSTRRKDLFIKLNKYKNAGVREYWMIDPDRKTVMTWDFENDDEVKMYGFRDRIPVAIYQGECVIDFAEIDNLVTPWM